MRRLSQTTLIYRIASHPRTAMPLLGFMAPPTFLNAPRRYSRVKQTKVCSLSPPSTMSTRMCRAKQLFIETLLLPRLSWRSKFNIPVGHEKYQAFILSVFVLWLSTGTMYLTSLVAPILTSTTAHLRLLSIPSPFFCLANHVVGEWRRSSSDSLSAIGDRRTSSGSSVKVRSRNVLMNSNRAGSKLIAWARV